MKSFLGFVNEAAEATGSAAKAKIVNVGSAKWPLHAKSTSPLKTKHEDGSTHHVGGFVPPDYPTGGGSTKGDVMIHHKGETYSHTGKVGKNKKGEKSYEYKTEKDQRLWVTKSGHAHED